MYAVIMAGGRGTRFWPLSRAEKPKHLLNIAGERSIIQQTVDRISAYIAKEDIYVVTVAIHAAALAAQLPDIPRDNIIVEPVGRNTAPCIGLAALYLKRRNPDETMAVLPADHLITDEGRFVETLAAADEMARRTPSLITIGITPTRAETGYGYIERGEMEGRAGGREIFRVGAFREKPDRATAQRFLQQGGFYWNSGMFVWTVATILEEIERLLPDLSGALDEMDAVIGTAEERARIADIYAGVTPISIDYGVMERSTRVLLVEGTFGWSDIGSWDALWEVLGKDGDDNAVTGDHIAVKASRNLVHSSGKLVTLVGVSDIIIVESEDSILVCKRGSSQEVKDAVDILEARKMDDYL